LKRYYNPKSSMTLALEIILPIIIVIILIIIAYYGWKYYKNGDWNWNDNWFRSPLRARY
jgi:heme/copper-type cytochrome/quinol oxidase subunit 2